jgi:hypothetical protein
MRRRHQDEHQPDEDDQDDHPRDGATHAFSLGVSVAASVELRTGIDFHRLRHATGDPTNRVTMRRSPKRATTKTAVSRSFERVDRCCTPSPQIGPVPPPVD